MGGKTRVLGLIFGTEKWTKGNAQSEFNSSGSSSRQGTPGRHSSSQCAIGGDKCLNAWDRSPPAVRQRSGHASVRGTAPVEKDAGALFSGIVSRMPARSRGPGDA